MSKSKWKEEFEETKNAILSGYIATGSNPMLKKIINAFVKTLDHLKNYTESTIIPDTRREMIGEIEKMKFEVKEHKVFGKSAFDFVTERNFQVLTALIVNQLKVKYKVEGWN